MRVVQKPRLAFRPDPTLGWSLTPNTQVNVRFRHGVVQTIGPDGCRKTLGGDHKTGPSVGIYGCSFTYGTGLAEAETFASILQAGVDDARIINKGIGGHGTLQNYIQFRHDLALGNVDAAVFAVISDHRFRNIALPHRMEQYKSAEWYKLGVEHVPVAKRNSDGRLRVEYVPLWQPSLFRKDFMAFLPDDYMIDDATFAVMSEIEIVAKEHGVPVQFALLDQLDTDFSTQLKKRFPDAMDVSCAHDRNFTFLPADPHPNVAANQLYAERLLPTVRDLIATAKAGLSNG